MIDGMNGILVSVDQAIRIEKYPFQTKEDLIVIDNLEAGKFRLFEYTGGPLNIQHLLWNNKYINAVLVAETIINESWKEEGIRIHKVFANFGYEYLIEPMVQHILTFAKYYNLSHTVQMPHIRYEECKPYAEKALVDFKLINGMYHYCTQN